MFYANKNIYNTPTSTLPFMAPIMVENGRFFPLGHDGNTMVPVARWSIIISIKFTQSLHIQTPLANHFHSLN